MKIIPVGGTSIQLVSENDIDTFNLGKISLKYFQSFHSAPPIDRTPQDQMYIEITRTQLVDLLLGV